MSVGGAREQFRLGPKGKQGGTGRTKVTRAGRASRQRSKWDNMERCGGTFNSDGAEEMYKRI